MSVQATVIQATNPNALFSTSEGRLLRSVPAKKRSSAYTFLGIRAKEISVEGQSLSIGSRVMQAGFTPQ
jgi:hypothetical protein